MRLTGAGAEFNAPNVETFNGASYVVRNGAHFTLPPHPTTPDGSHSYAAHFPVGGVNLYVPYKSPTFISAGNQSELDLNRVVGFNVTLGSSALGVPFGTPPGEFSAIEGGVIELNTLGTLTRNAWI